MEIHTQFDQSSHSRGDPRHQRRCPLFRVDPSKRVAQSLVTLAVPVLRGTRTRGRVCYFYSHMAFGLCSVVTRPKMLQLFRTTTRQRLQHQLQIRIATGARKYFPRSASNLPRVNNTRHEDRENQQTTFLYYIRTRISSTNKTALYW